MDDSGEIDLKFALEVHGLNGKTFSESESDHSSELDEYEEYKPPPVEINSDNVIVIYPSDEENKCTDNNIKEDSPSIKDLPVQNVTNTAEIRKESLNPQNNFKGDLPVIRPDFPNNMQPNQNYYNPQNVRAVPVFPNFNNMQQIQQPIQNYYNPHAIRGIPVISNPNNLQQFPHNAQNYSNPNAERIRPYFPNPNSIPQFYQTNQYIQNFNNGNSTAPIFNNVNGMGYNPYQFNGPLSPRPGLPYLNHPPNQYVQHPNQFQGSTLIKNTPPNETKSNFPPKSIHLSPKTVDIMNMFMDKNSKIVVSVEELVKAIVVGNLLKKSMNVSVIERFKIDCIPSEIGSRVREQFNMTISELDINPESIVYTELSSKIDELLCEYNKECLPSICDAENVEHDKNISRDVVEPTEITVSESSINFQQIEEVSTTIKSVDGPRKSTGTIPKRKRAKKARKLTKKGKTKELHVVENPVIDPYEEFLIQKLLLSVEEVVDSSKKNYEEICEDINDYIDSNNESEQLLKSIRQSTTKRNNIHSSTSSIELENKKNKRPTWKFLQCLIMIYGLTRTMISFIINNSIKICTDCFLWGLKH